MIEKLLLTEAVLFGWGLLAIKLLGIYKRKVGMEALIIKSYTVSYIGIAITAIVWIWQ